MQAWWTNPDQVFKVIMPFLALGVIAAIVFIQEGQRRIPIQYAKRVIGRRMSGGGQTYLPLRVNMAGVIPVIFAASIMAFPPTVGELLPGAKGLSTFFSPNGWAYIVGETIFIILFTYFYTAVTFNPVDQADNLKKYGGFIPGVRPGRPTAEFLDRILARLTFPGALYLAAVAALPTILINQTSRELLLRRHLDPDRHRRRARHHEAARGAADDAQLRGLPEVACRRAARTQPSILVSELNLILWALPGPARARRPRACARTSTSPTSPRATCCASTASNETELGKQAAKYMDDGELVPDELVIAMILERDRGRGRRRLPARRLPAHLAQAEALDEELEKRGRRLTAALLIDAPRRGVIRAPLRPARVLGRATSTTSRTTRRSTRASATRTASRCASATTTSPRRSGSGSTTYHEQTEPLIEYYEQRGLLRAFDGTRSPSEVHDHIRATLATLRLEERL